MLTQKRLMEVMSYDSLNGLFTWVKPSSNRVKVNDLAGCVCPDGYIKINVDGKPYKAHRLAWLYITGEMPTHEIDHVDGVRSNNQLVNLRQATSKQNKENTGLKRTNNSGYKGVHWDKARQKWLAFVTHNRKFHNLGRFNDLNEAVIVSKQARDALFTHHNTSYSN